MYLLLLCFRYYSDNLILSLIFLLKKFIFFNLYRKMSENENLDDFENAEIYDSEGEKEEDIKY